MSDIQYVLILVWIGFIALFQKLGCKRKYIRLSGRYERRATFLYAFIVMLPVICMAGFRGWDAYFDTGLYIRGFWEMPSSFSRLPAYLKTQSKDVGFYLMSALIKIILGPNEDIYFFIIAFIQGVCILSLFQKYSSEYMLSVFLFIASTDYISGMFNGIRQFMAVAIIYAATPLMVKKKYVPLILTILFASFFHRSAIIMIPLILISQGKAWNKKTLLLLCGVLLAVTFVGSFTGFMDSALQETQYANVVSDYTSWNDNGANPVRVLVYSIPCLLSFVLRKRIKKEKNPFVHFCTNMSIITMALYILAMFTSGIFMGRLPIYCNLYSYILLPWELECLFGKRNKIYIYAIVVICYLLYYYFAMHFQYGII